MALATGAKLGPYELASSIGAGGMGEVYRAHDQRLGRDVAVKIIPASFASDASRVRRFEQEARAAAALNHPNILAVYDIGTHGECPYIVSELLEGQTLRERLRDGPPPIRKVVDYALQIARGLAAAHDRGIVHRDLKPDNIFITNDGRVKILDFGLAKLTRPDTAADDLTKTVQSDPGTVLGTVGYMSPEQVRGKETDARSDIFSFGAVLYEMISGKRAFHGDSAADVLSAILKEEPPDMTAANQNVSPALDRVERHCLEKNPAERFQSAHDLAFNLEALTGISNVVSEIPTPSARRRSWLLPALAAALAAALVAAFFLGRTTHGVSKPDFHQVTFRSGTVYRARFANDGSSILYSAAWEGKPIELFTSRYGSVESRSLAPETVVAAISSKNQVAILLNPRFLPAGSIPLAEGTLALLPIEGGTPRPVLRGVEYADWTPDGSELAILRVPEGEARGLRSNMLQFPIDKTIYAPARGWLSDLRFSPDGKYLAFEEHVPSGDDGKIVVVDLAGKKITESPHYSAVNGMAWASNKELWFTGSPGDTSRALMAMDLRGRTREVYRAPGDLTLYDISANGHVLLSADNARLMLFGGVLGGPDKDMSWLGWSLAASISEDGLAAVFSESAAAVGGRPVALIRKLDRSPAVELGEGLPMEISPDGNWVVTLDTHDPPNIILLPTGVGKSKQLTSNGWDYPTRYWIRWMPNSAALSLMAVQPGHKPRVFLLDVATKEMRPLLPEGVRGGLPSPDGKFLFGIDGNTPKIYTTSGSEIRALPQLGPDDVPDRWAADGKSVFIWNYSSAPRLDHMDIASGKRVHGTTISPADRTGIVGFNFCRTSKDGSAHIYSAYRLLMDLFVVNGLK
jgi:eukaryotic-like serine/threonine-protein kinase